MQFETHGLQDADQLPEPEVVDGSLFEPDQGLAGQPRSLREGCLGDPPFLP